MIMKFQVGIISHFEASIFLFSGIFHLFLKRLTDWGFIINFITYNNTTGDFSKLI